MWKALHLLENSLKMKPFSTNWRDNDQYYRAAAESRFPPGTVSFSLAWFQQGMVVR
jgi:hypothetical protein